MIRVEHNVATGEIVEVQLSTKEVKELEQAAADRLVHVAEFQAKENSKAALLARLGISAEEAQLLLG
jgi:hypothetical protein